ncbi:hypothetical protein [Shewanella gaetbuli]|uniref:Uncharacterized protein n=1 Tax=Shewanella gaetbuli TaxID=220752 RepID=A0A9X1ZU59_9GAMM|nr:hypothetical protein [Shewanella gaetbuli]MCL1144163.1 hypothetical protein [Shewanella gaetbuli]
MNEGKLEKVFITCGEDVSVAMARFASKWDKGYVTHIEATPTKSFFEEIALNTSRDKAFFILVDANAESLSQAQDLISNTWVGGQSEVICFTSNKFSTDPDNIHSQLELNSQQRMQIFSIVSFEPVISAYGHVMTGLSISCIGFDDIYSILNTGTTVKMHEVACDNLKESPFSLYTGYEKLISEGKQDALTLTGVVVVLIGDISDQNLMEATNACCLVLRGLVHNEDVNLHTSFQSGAKSKVLLCGVLKEATGTKLFNEGKGLPGFLKL